MEVHETCFELFLTVHLQVASATATFVMMFSSSLSVAEFYLLRRFPIPYGNSQFHTKLHNQLKQCVCSYSENLTLFLIHRPQFVFHYAALYLTSVSIMAGFWGQFLIRKLITFLRRTSIIVFILSAVIFASALTMGNFKEIQSITVLHRTTFSSHSFFFLKSEMVSL